jgi:hypothetical protein
MPERIYEEPSDITEKEVLRAIEEDDIERLTMICIDLGFNHENWRFIQDISVRLTEHPNANVRGNAFFGLEYAARFRGKVEKNIVKPVLLRGIKDEDPEVAGKAQDAINNINHLMGWNIGGAKRQKEIERIFSDKNDK